MAKPERTRFNPQVTGPFVLVIALTLVAANKNSPADLNLVSLEGQRVHLRDYRGKVVVLNFWATWCGPCKEEMPLMAEMEKTYAPKGIVFLGASLDEKQTRPGVPKFLAAHQITFPIWVGATGDDLARLGLGEAIPATAFLDEHGIIFARVLGQIRKAEILERLERITGDRAGTAPEPLVKHLP